LPEALTRVPETLVEFISVCVLPLPEKTQIGTGKEQKLQNVFLSHLLASGILPEIRICPKQERWLGSISCAWCRPGLKYYLKSFEIRNLCLIELA
jgi:hypothetical protein